MLHPPRRATEADLSAVEALVAAAYGQYVSRIGRRPRPMLANYRNAIASHSFWLVEREQGLAGLIELIAADDHLLIENVAVSPAFQRSGIGRALIAFAELEAQRQGYAEVRLYTNALFTENLALYSRLGYRETHREQLHDTCIVHMAKTV